MICWNHSYIIFKKIIWYLEVFNPIYGRPALAPMSIPPFMGAFKRTTYSHYSGFVSQVLGVPGLGLVELFRGSLHMAHLGSTCFRKRPCMVLKVQGWRLLSCCDHSYCHKKFEVQLVLLPPGSHATCYNYGQNNANDWTMSWLKNHTWVPACHGWLSNWTP